MLARYIYFLGEKLRNPSLRNNFLFLKRSEKWTLEKLENYQLKKLKEVLHIAYHHSEFYKRKFNEVNLDIESINTLDDLKLLPIISKKDLIAYNKEIHTNLKFKKTILATTSGTSGESLKFLRNENADSFNRAAIQRGYSWHNVNPWERNGYFWGFNFSLKERIKSFFLDLLQNRFRIFSYNNKVFKSFIKKARKASYIHGYSSMIYQTAVLINKLKLQKPKKLKMVKGTSEKIFDSYQKEIQQAFGVKMISEYGAAESGIIAFECKEGNMHINMEGVIVESLNNEILITNLQMHSFPIIRYKLGDYIHLASKNEKCKCGRNHLIIEEVTGRIGENVYGKKRIYPSLYFYYIFKNLSKKHDIHLNYQVIQNIKGELIFLIDKKSTTFLTSKLSQEIEKYFKDDISFEIKQEANFMYKKGKLKNFISNLNE